MVLDFKIHTMTGDLVYSSIRRNDFKKITEDSLPIWEWDLRNNHKNYVATGVYIYSVHEKKGRILKKGKIAVIR